MYSDIVWFFNAAGFSLELTAAMAMFTWWVKRRDGFAVRFACFMVVIIVFSLLWQVFVPYIVWSLIIRCLAFYLLCLWGLHLCLNLDWRQSLFYAVAGIALQHIVYCAARMAAMQFA